MKRVCGCAKCLDVVRRQRLIVKLSGLARRHCTSTQHGIARDISLDKHHVGVKCRCNVSIVIPIARIGAALYMGRNIGKCCIVICYCGSIDFILLTDLKSVSDKILYFIGLIVNRVEMHRIIVCVFIYTPSASFGSTAYP